MREKLKTRTCHFLCNMSQKQSIWCTLLIPSIWTMNHRIWHFKRTNFDPLALVQKSCCGLLPSRGLCPFIWGRCVFYVTPCICPAASMENSFVSRVWLARGSLLIVLYCSKAKMRYNDELIRQIQKDCLHWTRPSLCSSIFFPRKNTLSTPVLFISKRFFLWNY